VHKPLGYTLEHVAELTNHDLELEKAMGVKAEQEMAILKEEKRKLEYCVSDLINIGHAHKHKLKKIAEILKEWWCSEMLKLLGELISLCLIYENCDCNR
jgi:hypothetical protein